MAKTFLISAGLVIIIVLLIIIATRQPTLVTTPAPAPITVQPERPTPRAPEPERGTPTPKAPEVIIPPGGVPAEVVYPQEAEFWVNEIRVPATTTYEEGLNFIPIKEDRLKTFAGRIGPYFEDPTPYIRVVLCAELYKVAAAPACEIVPIIWRENFVSFAKGYQFDEYIGGMAAKDYLAYYDVYAGDAVVAHSNRAVIRTVKD